MNAPTHGEAMHAFFASKGIATRPHGKRLYLARRKGWNGCRAFVEFEAFGGDPNSMAWEEQGGLFGRCRLRVIPREGGKNWQYCARVENEIMTILEGASGEVATADELKAAAARLRAATAEG